MRNVLKGLFFYEAETCGEPQIDLYETADELVYEADLPGIDVSNVSVKIYEDLLIIEGFNINNESGVLKYLCMERSLKNFRRVLKIPTPVNTVAGEALYANGVLTVKFPKLKGKLIKIKIEKK